MPTVRTGESPGSVDRSAMDPLYICVAGFMVVSVARLHLLFPLFGVVRPILLLALLSLALFILDRHPERSLSTLATPPFLFLVALVVWMTLGIPFALRQGSTFFFLLDRFSRTVILFVLVAAVIRGIRDAERLAWLYFAGASLYAAVVLFRFEIGEGGWRLSDLVTYDANDFSLLAVTAIPIGIYFVLRKERSGLMRCLDATGVLALLTAFVWAGSRGGFVALAVAGLFFLIGFREVPLRWRAGGLAMAALVVALTATPQYWEQMRSIANPQEDYNLSSPTGRLQIWKRGVGYMLDNPVFGVGASNFPAAEGMLSPRAELQEYGIGVWWASPHNSYVQVGAETGIPGLLLFLGFLGATFAGLRRFREDRGGGGGGGDPALERLPRVLAVSLVGFMVGAFFLTLAYSDMLYALTGIAGGIGKLATRRREATSPLFLRSEPWGASS